MANKNTQYTVSVKVIGDDNLKRLMSQMDQLATKTKTYTNSTKGMASAAQNVSKSSGQMGRVVQNMSYQMQDFIVQVTGGTDAMRAFGQQAPQMLVGLGAIGALVGVGFALAPVALALFDIESAMDKATKASKEFEDILGSIGDGFNTINFDGWIESYNEADAAGRVALANLLEIRAQILELNKDSDKIVFGEKLKDQMDDLFGGDVNIGKNIRATMEELGIAVTAENRNITELFRGLIAGTADVSTAYETLKNASTTNLAITENMSAETKAFLLSLGELAVKEEERAKALADIANLQVRVNEAQTTGNTIIKETIDLTEQQNVALQFARDMVKRNQEINKKNAEEAARLAKEQERAAERAAAAAKRQAEQVARAAEQEKKRLQNAAAAVRAAVDPYSAFNQEMEKLNELLDSGNLSWEHYSEAVFKAQDALDGVINKEATEEIERLAAAARKLDEDFASAVTGPMTGFFDDIISGAKSGKQAFEDMAVNIVRQLANMAIQMMVVKPLFDAITGGGFGSSFFGSAKGNVIAGGMPLNAFATGGIVGGRTVMGRNLIGEAGPEAVLPLTRHGGQLGVKASPVNVNITNNAGAEISVNETESADGTRTIDMVIEAKMKSAFSSGSMDKMMRANYGVRRRGE